MSSTKDSSTMEGGCEEGGEPSMAGGRRTIFSEAALLSDKEGLCWSRPASKPNSSVKPLPPADCRPSPISDEDADKERASPGDKFTTASNWSMSEDCDIPLGRLFTGGGCPLTESRPPPPAINTRWSLPTSLSATSSDSSRLGTGGLSPLGGEWGRGQ